MKKSKHISVALEESDYIKLTKLAKDDVRSISGLVRHLIRLYIRGGDNKNIQVENAE